MICNSMKYLIITLTFFLIFKESYAVEKLYLPYIINYVNYTAVKPLNIQSGDITKGKKIFKSRKTNCLSCHEVPMPEEKFQGNFGPSLSGVGSKYSKEEIRIRLINAKIINPDTIMPSYFKVIDYPRTKKKYLGKTILEVEEVEHLVEYLYSLK